MVLENIPRSHKFQNDPYEEHWVIVEMEMEKNLTKNWKKLKPKHQYFVLPYNIYKNEDKYYMFNARQIIMSAFDVKKIQTIKMVYLSAFIISVALSGALAFLLFVAGPMKDWRKKAFEGKGEEKEKENEKGKENDEKKKKKEKK